MATIFTQFSLCLKRRHLYLLVNVAPRTMVFFLKKGDTTFINEINFYTALWWPRINSRTRKSLIGEHVMGAGGYKKILKKIEQQNFTPYVTFLLCRILIINQNKIPNMNLKFYLLNT